MIPNKPNNCGTPTGGGGGNAPVMTCTDLFVATDQAVSGSVSASGGTSPYTFAMTSGPTWLTMSSGGVLSGTAGAVGAYTIMATVTDAAGMMASCEFTMTVTQQNTDPPTITCTDCTVMEGGVVNESTSTANGTAPYSYTLVSGPTWITVDATTGAVTGTAPAGSAGSYSVVVQVTDSQGQSAQCTKTVTVTAVVDQLVINCTDCAAIEGGAISESTSTTGGVPAYTYSKVTGPTWITVNPSSGQVTGTSPAGSAGTYTVTVGVTDSAGNTAQCSKTVTITEVAAEITAICPSVADSITECAGGSSMTSHTYTGSGTVTYSISGAPAWASINPATGEITYTNPPAGSAGTYSFTVTVSDGTVSDSCTMSVIVNENLAPSITNCPTSVTYQNGVVTNFQFTGTDPEGDTLSWSAGGLPAGMNLTGGGNLTGVPTSDGTGAATITVNDGCGNSVDCTFNWTVTSDDCCPSVSPINDFCFDHCFPPGDSNANCDRIWNVEVNNNCPSSGFDITVSPASNRIVVNEGAGTVTLLCGYMPEGSHVVTYRAISADGTQCPQEQFTIKSICPTSVGLNSSFNTYWAAERPFIDQMKLSGFTRDNVTAAESAGWPVDNCGWGTEVGPVFQSYFYTNEQAVTSGNGQENFLTDTCWRVMWEGTGNVAVTGFNLVSGVSNISANEIQFNMNQNQIGNARVTWTNTVAGDHVRNVRIVPCAFADAYRNWSWEDFDCSNKNNNPPIFDPCWLERICTASTYRFMAGWATNDWRTYDTNPVQDHSDFMIDVCQPNFYDNWFSGTAHDPARGGIRSHSWPPELVACLARECDIIPHINFEGGTWENLINGDTYVQEFAQRICACGYDGPIKVEFGNEPWNQGGVFSVFNQYLKGNPHPSENTGNGTQGAASRNYARLSNEVIQAFKDAYCNPCKVMGVFNSQHYNIGWWNDAKPLLDKKCFTLETGPYYSNDIGLSPGSDLYNAIINHLNGGGSQAQLNQLLLNELLDSSWIGAGNSNPKHDIAGACAAITQYANEAHNEGMCYAAYEAGLHINVGGMGGLPHQLTGDNARVRDAIIAFLESTQAAQADATLLQCAKDNCSGPFQMYASMASNAFTIWSYWDHNCDAYTPRASQIGNWNNTQRETCEAGWDTNTR